MAVRTIACLPALTGAWRHPGCGALLSTSGTFPLATEALERPDLVPPGTRTLNMSQLGRILTDETLDPPVKALFVYNSNPAAVAPDQESVRKGLVREDLFTVVHELFPTDTVDFADIVLPATTTLEHYDIHKAYGHLYLSLSRPAIDPLGESLPNTELFRRLAARMGLEHPSLRETDEEMARQALDWSHPHLAGHHVRAAGARGLDPAERTRSARALRGGRRAHGVREVRAALGSARQGKGSILSRATLRRARTCSRPRSAPSASRLPSSRPPPTTS